MFFQSQNQQLYINTKGTRLRYSFHLLCTLLETCRTVGNGYCEFSLTHFLLLLCLFFVFFSTTPATETQASLSKGFLTRVELFMLTMARFSFSWRKSGRSEVRERTALSSHFLHFAVNICVCYSGASRQQQQQVSGSFCAKCVRIRAHPSRCRCTYIISVFLVMESNGFTGTL